jgi:hypothetical protein
MKKLVVFMAMFFMSMSISFGANARGQLLRYGPYSPYPVSSLTVILRYANGSDASSPAVTGPDGMYYFYQMMPNSYFLDVYNGRVFLGRFAIVIMNTPNLPGVFTDIPPIVLNN